jgi:DNA-binding transcriptional ArsR family regulator
MTSRETQDVILRLLADGPLRAAALAGAAETPQEVKATLARTDAAALDRFGRFLSRHYYRERVVHYFKYARALAPLTGRAPEGALKTAAFRALVPQLVLGERASAERVLALLRDHLLRDAEAVRRKLPYWDDLVGYQAAFFLADALPPERPPTRFPARAPTAAILELDWDLPAVLLLLLRPFAEPPMPPRQPTRLLFARSPAGEVTALRCTDALKDLLDRLTGLADPSELAVRMGIDHAAFEKTLSRLEELGAVVAREAFSSSHVGSELSPTARDVRR